MNSKHVADYAYLAEASYADFTGISDIEDVKKRAGKTVEKIQERDSEAEELAKLVTKNYTVEAHWKDEAGDGADSIKSPASGFSGTLFKSVGDGGRYVLALKGSLGPKDLAIADAGNIATDGLAHHQIVDSSSLV